MNKQFERLVRTRCGNRYNLVKDVEGYYANEVVKRMYEFWRLAKGII